MEIYADYAATTPVKPEVVDAMMTIYNSHYGNPSSIHAKGRDARKYLDESRRQIAQLLGADTHEIIFTSGATESNNTAIKGIVKANEQLGNHIITSKIEHHSVLHVFEQLEREGFDVTYLDVDDTGAIDLDQLDGVYKFPEEVSLLQQYFGPAHQQAYVRAYPAVGKNVPLYILGSSTDSAHLAARKGLPYVFAGHFAPQQMKEAIEIYKTLFEPSDVLDEPYVIVCLNTIVAENDDEAQYLASSMAQVMVSITRGRMQPVQPPTHELQNILTPREYAMAMERQKISLIGSENTVQQKIQDFMETYGEVNEIMAISYIYDKDMQLDSYRRFKNVINQLNEKNTL